MLKFFGNKKQSAAASISENSTFDKVIPELEITPPTEEPPLCINNSEEIEFKETLNYVVVRTSQNSTSDIEILYPINVPKEFVNNPGTEKLKIINEDKKEKDKAETVIVEDDKKELSGEEEPILHA